MARERVPAADIDVAILTKELEIAFAEQLIKCTKSLQQEVVADREGATATTLEYLLAQVDYKLLHFKQELLDEVHKYLEDKPPMQIHAQCVAGDVKEKSPLDPAADVDSIRSASLVSNPSELEVLAQNHLPSSEGDCVHPIHAILEEAPPRVNIAAYILQFTRVHAPEKALYDCHSGETLSYEALVDVVGCLAHNLHTVHGLCCTDIMWLPMVTPSPLRTFLVILAVWTLGGAIVWSTSPPPLATWTCLESTANRSTKSSQSATDCPGGLVLRVLRLDEIIDRDQTPTDVWYSDLVATPSTPWSVHPVKAPHWVVPSKVAMTVQATTTSDDVTTFAYSHRDILVALETSVETFRRRFQHPRTTFLCSLPLAAPEALTFAILPNLFYGTTLYFLPPPHLADLPKALRVARPTVLVTTSLHLSELAKANDAVACVEEIVCIGMSVPSLPRALRALHTLSSKWCPDLKFRRLYASPATAGVCMQAPPTSFPIPPTQLRALGSAVSNDVQVCVRSLATGVVLGPKQVGELCVQHRDLNHATEMFATKAMAYVDMAGQVHGIGSKDGIVNLGAESTTTLELEEVLASHPLVDDAVVVVAANAGSMTAYVKLAPAAATYIDDALRSVSIFAAKQIPPAKQLGGIVRVRDIHRELDGQPSFPVMLQEAKAINSCS
ncbi:hypothetical protein, variant 2 [Aphanomyces invadans]|uniref:AMP-dependent synthetase/ligase domain-containing protein n=1 Tax=Aphanomyces invadans TaxID=157072 RepID=A0A024U7Z1_9STRA|nr:hypothetical protein, variant 2 [Aphanomyces invadans]ETW02330.1 hypothetical protein, variant 2 [Aphanomyces invadans]|eukprot:XP_008868935.1 hypothetical protein, variant 2 [Aphanomyces invadans]